jgi:hypothetical protein
MKQGLALLHPSKLQTSSCTVQLPEVFVDLPEIFLDEQEQQQRQSLHQLHSISTTTPFKFKTGHRFDQRLESLTNILLRRVLQLMKQVMKLLDHGTFCSNDSYFSTWHLKEPQFLVDAAVTRSTAGVYLSSRRKSKLAMNWRFLVVGILLFSHDLVFARRASYPSRFRQCASASLSSTQSLSMHETVKDRLSSSVAHCQRTTQPSTIDFSMVRGGSDNYNYNYNSGSYTWKDSPRQPGDVSDMEDENDEYEYNSDNQYYYDDRGRPNSNNNPAGGDSSSSSSTKNIAAAATSFVNSLPLPKMIRQGDRRIGLMMLGGGSVITLLAIMTFFNRFLMRIGNILLIAGVTIFMGIQPTVTYFLRPEKYRATLCLGFGIFLVIMAGWPMIGLAFEIFGLLNLFGNMFPMLWMLAKATPGIGPILQSISNPRDSSKTNDNNHNDGRSNSYPEYTSFDENGEYYDNDWEQQGRRRGNGGNNNYNQQW